MDRLLTVNEVMERVPLAAHGDLRERTKAGRFPQPVRIGGNKIRWRESDIEAYLTPHAPENDAA